ncbi:DUF6723 family protein [Caballeronia sp. LZ065]|uniref:DUF6723 family protein n=1 Tax=Caballeronia sp. LZ065 TaxID=3038571 RepID=UPI003857E082
MRQYKRLPGTLKVVRKTDGRLLYPFEGAANRPVRNQSRRNSRCASARRRNRSRRPGKSGIIVAAPKRSASVGP